MDDSNFELFIKYFSKKKLQVFGGNDIRRAGIYEIYQYELFGALDDLLIKKEVPVQERLTYEEFDNIETLKIIKHILIACLTIKKEDYDKYLGLKKQIVEISVRERNELLKLTMDQLSTMVATRVGLYK